MTWRYDDRVKVTTSAPNTGAFPYNSAAVTGFNPFTSIPSIVNGDTAPYTAWDGAGNWETGYITYSTATGLARTVKRNSAGSTSAINFTGAVTVWCSINAAFAVVMDPNGNASATTFNNSTLAVSTQQKFLSGASATYMTPTGCRQILVRMKGAGGGGGGAGLGAGPGSSGGDTIFNGVHAGGGAGSTANGSGGAGGTSATGAASLRLPGAPGENSATQIWTATTFLVEGGGGGGQGGAPGAAAGGGSSGNGGAANSGGGGGGACTASAAQTTIATYAYGGGGGEGEYVEILITAPAASYTFTVGAGGNGGAAGSGLSGGGGGSGIIEVTEYY